MKKNARLVRTFEVAGSAEDRVPSLRAKQAWSLACFSRLKARWAHRHNAYVPQLGGREDAVP